MAQEGFKRKLTAILSADVKGYSRLMGEDEVETIQTPNRLSGADGKAYPAAPRQSSRLSGR